MCYHSSYAPYKSRHRHPRHHWRKGHPGSSNRWHPSVNVEELDDRYELFLFAPGFQKSDFSVGVKDNVLIISMSPAEGSGIDGPNYLRQEFKHGRFERQFALNEKIDASRISAKYEDGILQVTLPKIAGMETVRQEISIL